MTSDIFYLINLSGPLVVWDSPSLDVRVNLLQDSSGIGILDEPVGFLLEYKLGFPLGRYVRFIDVASCWTPVYCVHPTWVKIKIPWLGGIYLDIHTCGSYLRILSKVSATYLWGIPYFSLTSHTFCESLCGVTYSPLESWVQLELPRVQRR